ncbi:MAG: hypothetical protein J2P55_03775 [Rhizobiales bacterium]|nr:hypothetical protein [Hyphomicrobiales bacterium]
MFKIDFFVDDKKLAPALRALAGLALGDPKVTPVINAAPTANGKGIKQITDGSLLELFAVFLRKTKLAEVTPKHARDFLTNAGRSPSSASYLLRNAVEARMLKPSAGKGTKTSYQVNTGSKG